MNVLRLHLRTSPLRWAVLPLAAGALLILLIRPRYWIGSWPETGAAAQVSAFFLSILAAAAASWVSGSVRRHGMGEQLAAASLRRSRMEWRRFAVTAALLLAPYLAGHVAAFVITARDFPPGLGLWAGYLLMGLVVMLFAIGWGWLIGRYLAPVYAALVAALSWVVFETFPAEAAYLGVLDGPPWLQPDVRSLIVRAAAVALLIGALVLLPPRPVRRGPDWGAAVVSGSALLVAMVATVTTTGVSERAVPAEPYCVAGRMEICLWPENRKYTPVVQEIDGRAATLPPVWQTPPRLLEYGLKRQVVKYRGRTFTQLEGDFQFSEGNKWALALGASEAIINESLKQCDWDRVRAAEDSTPEALRKWVELYLANSATPPYQTIDASESMRKAWATATDVFTGMSAPQQDQWVSRQFATVRAEYCG